MTRAEEIHATWARFHGAWPRARGVDGWYFLPCVRLVIRRPMPKVILSAPPEPRAMSQDVLTFIREPGYMEGKRWFRVMCEGVVVEDGPA